MSPSHSLPTNSLGDSIANNQSFSARLDAQELLDIGAGTPADVATNLAEMWRINRYFGGFIPITRHLYPHIVAAESPMTVVDLGTGSAQMLCEIVQWARTQQRTLRCIGVDWAGRNLAVARQNIAVFSEITLLQANALNLPYAPNSIDCIISSLFLHHFTPEQVIRLLRTAYTVARRAIIMTDLVRGWLPLAGFRLIQPFFARNFLTRHDGVLSIRRSYTLDELHNLVDAAELPNARIIAHWPWRMTLVAHK
jgi:hypothetical protein